MLIRRICILKLGTRAERFNEEGFSQATYSAEKLTPLSKVDASNKLARLHHD
jgi:hypothetical protein